MSTPINARFQLQFGDFSLDVDETLPGRGVTAIFGHSGSGKTTFLRCVAGLERATGRLCIGAEVWQDGHRFVPVHRRSLGYVFQEASLFPHLSVKRNLLYGRRRTSHSERSVDYQQAVELLGIGHLLDRRPQRLSGGERQRVAIARALLNSPRLLLMDEPLSALDERSKAEILPYLERLHGELAIPVLYVSHSLKEVARLADHMVWMEGGRARMSGALQEVLTSLDFVDPSDEEAGAVLDARVALHDDRDHLTALDSGCGRLWVRRLDLSVGAPLRVRLPARDISLGLSDDGCSSILNIWQARVDSLEEFSRGQVVVRLRCPRFGNAALAAPLLLARITLRSARRLNLRPGLDVYVRVKSVGLLD